jgi:hypothetical protein
LYRRDDGIVQERQIARGIGAAGLRPAIATRFARKQYRPAQRVSREARNGTNEC